MTHCKGCHSDDDTPNLRAGSVELDRRKEDDGKWKMEDAGCLDDGTKCNQSSGDGLRWEMACRKSGKELYRHPALHRAALKPSVWLQNQQARLGH